MPANILVYGACGQLGQVMVKKLVEIGHTVVAVDLRQSDLTPHSVPIKGDGSKEDAAQVVAKVNELNLGGTFLPPLFRIAFIYNYLFVPKN